MERLKNEEGGRKGKYGGDGGVCVEWGDAPIVMPKNALDGDNELFFLPMNSFGLGDFIGEGALRRMEISASF